MTVKNVGKAKVALGLNWKPLKTENIKSEAQSLGKANKQSLGAIWENSDHYVAQVGLSGDKKHSGALAGAAIFAAIVPSGLIVQSITKDRVWVCFTKDHNILVGYDFIAKHDEAKRRINDLLNGSEGDEDPLEGTVVIADSQSEQFALELTGADIKVQTLEEVFEDGLKPFPKGYSELRVKPVDANPARNVISALGLLGFLGYAYVTQTAEPPQEDPEMAKGLATLNQPLEKKVDPDKERNEKLQVAASDAEAEEMRWLKEDFERGAVRVAMDHVLAQVDWDNLVRSGWNMDQILFVTNSESTHLISKWSTTFGTPVDFVNEFGDYGTIGLTGREGTVKYDVARKAINVEASAFVKDMKESSLTIEEIMTHLDRLKVSWTMGYEEVSGRPETHEALAKIDRDMASARQLKQKWTSLTVTGSSEKTLKAAVAVLASSKNVLTETLQFDFENGIAWELRGRIYEL